MIYLPACFVCSTNFHTAFLKILLDFIKMKTAIDNKSVMWRYIKLLLHGSAASDSHSSVLWHVSCHMQMILPLRVSWTLMACNRGCSILFLARYWSNRQIACPSHTHKIVFSRLFFWRKKKKRFYGMHATPLERYKNASHSATWIPNL